MQKNELIIKYSESLKSIIQSSIKSEDKLRIAKSNLKSQELDKLILIWCIENYYNDELNEILLDISVVKYFELFKFLEKYNSSKINQLMLLNGIEMCKVILENFTSLSMENKKKHTKEIISTLIKLVILAGKYSNLDKVNNPITQVYTTLINSRVINTKNDKLTPEIINSLLEAIYEYFELVGREVLNEFVIYNTNVIDETNTYFSWNYKHYEHNYTLIKQIILELKNLKPDFNS